MSATVTNLMSLAAMLIGISSVVIARRNYRRAKAHLEAVQARYPHLVKDADK